MYRWPFIGLEDRSEPPEGPEPKLVTKFICWHCDETWDLDDTEASRFKDDGTRECKYCGAECEETEVEEDE